MGTLLEVTQLFLLYIQVSWFYSVLLALHNHTQKNGHLLSTHRMAQLLKSPPAMLETWVRSLDWKDPLEKGKATHSSILAWRIPWTV